METVSKLTVPSPDDACARGPYATEGRQPSMKPAALPRLQCGWRGLSLFSIGKPPAPFLGIVREPL